MRKSLRERTKEIYRETSSRVRIGEDVGGFLDGMRGEARVSTELNAF